MPWDPGTPLDQRPAIVQQRIAALPAGTFAPFDAGVVTEDEIDLCLRWPDVPRPAVGDARAALSQRPDPDPAGRRRTSARRPSGRRGSQQRIPGAVRLVVPGAGHSTVGSERLRGRRHHRLRARPPAAVVVPAPADRRARPWRRRPRASRRCAATPGCRRRSGAPCARVAATIDDLRLVLSPAALATSGGGLRGGSWEVRGGRLILRDYASVPGVTVSGTVNRTFRLRVAGSKAARGTLTLARRAASRARSAGGGSPSAPHAARRPRRLRAPVGALTYQNPDCRPPGATVRTEWGTVRGRPTPRIDRRG